MIREMLDTWKAVMREIAEYTVEVVLYVLLSVVLAMVFTLVLCWPVYCLFGYPPLYLFYGVLIFEISLVVLKMMWIVHTGIRIR